MKTLLFTLFILVFNATSAQEKYTKSNLNLRSHPNTESEILYKLAQGTAVTVLSEPDNGWTYVSADGYTGYVSTSYLIDEPISNPVKKEAEVLICNSSSSYAYHSYQCHGLKRCKAGISSISISEARNSYSPCKICY